MKGYGIEITNNLLDPKHVGRIGAAIWEYMWCIDKMTAINDDGLGKILGGKPVKWAEIKKDLGKSESSIGENMNRLQNEGYVNLLRTPFGHVITVNKAKKRFGKKTPENAESDSGKDRIELRKTPSLTPENARNKEDNTVRHNSKTNTAEDTSAGSVVEIIKLFEEVNPACKKFYGNTTQRKACQDLLDQYGFDQVANVIGFLRRSNTMPFVPTITTPVQLWEKWEGLASSLAKKKVELRAKGRGLET